MLCRLKRLTDDSGETLVEICMTIVILGVCAVAMGAGIAISVKISDVHRKQALAQQFLHNYAETLQASPYQSCTFVTPNYASGLATPPNGGPWTVSQSAIQYWNGTTFTSSCQTPDRLQEVTLSLHSGGGLVDESVVVVLRNPS